MKRIVGTILLSVALVLCVFSVDVSATTVKTQLRVAFNQNQAPYHFVDDSNQATGLHVDLLEYIASRTRLEFTYFPMETGTDCRNALEEGDVDIILDVTLYAQNDAWTTSPFSEATISAIMPSHLVESDTKPKVSVFQLRTITPAISSELNTSYSIAVGNQRSVVDHLLTGKADIMVGMKDSLLYYLSDFGQEDNYTVVNNYMGIVSFVARVPENDYYLLQLLNREIANLRASGMYETIRGRWIHQDMGHVYLVWLKAGAAVLFGLIAAVVIYVFFSYYIQRALKRQVDQQTAELLLANREIQRHLEQLEQEADLRKRIIHYSYLGILVYDAKYQIRLMNDSALSLVGWREVPQTVVDVRQMKVFGEIIESYDRKMRSEQNADRIESDILTTMDLDGVIRRYRYMIQQILKTGKTGGVLLMVEDITDEEAKRQEMFETEKNKILNQVVAGIAHEIKNPLTAIKAFTGAVQEIEMTPEFLADFARYVPMEVDRINRLVEGLIGYAKPPKSEKERVDLSALLYECAFFSESMNLGKQICICTDIEDGHSILGSYDQLKQVMINIVLNGVEAMQGKLRQGEVDGPLTLLISLMDEDNNSVVHIRDEGTGMTQQAIARCLDPFFTTKKTGTGLGLTLSNQYVQENNGHIQITSQIGQFTDIQIAFRRDYGEIKDIDC